jgi:hypothetical protein
MKIKLDEIYEYYDIPLLFSANDKDGNIFICLFAEETDVHLKYICVQVSEKVFRNLESNTKDVRSIFEFPASMIYILHLNHLSNEEIDAVETGEDISLFLPEAGLFIGNKAKSHKASQTRVTSLAEA